MQKAPIRGGGIDITLRKKHPPPLHATRRGERVFLYPEWKISWGGYLDGGFSQKRSFERQNFWATGRRYRPIAAGWKARSRCIERFVKPVKAFDDKLFVALRAHRFPLEVNHCCGELRETAKRR